ncbi:hypothetical protein Cni_G18290 [Canna indica]|uniref:Uncharacterized protein n=1 Tax=Canna indica TaxID=4628 RepID=A0AAQ3KJ24_9LILI|nr:hypothetical protein Cni_G18290 [Canna indica]
MVVDDDDADTAVVLPRRDQGFRNPKGIGHHRRANLHHQQRSRGLPQRAPPAEAQQGRHQQLRGLRPEPPRLLPLLLPWLQDYRHRRRPQQEEADADEEESNCSSNIGLGGLDELLKPRQREEQRDAELHAAAAAAADGRGQLQDQRQEEEGHSPPSSIRKPHPGIVIKAMHLSLLLPPHS